jgi:DNA modification methylase
MLMPEIIHKDCREGMRKFPDNHFDSCVTDPPYELGFMGKKWDAAGIAYDVSMWAEVFRVLKPGAHLLAFGGTRTYHRMTCAIEDAGFEIRDSLHWIYGSGFPKSLDISKAIDKAAGAEREYVGEGPYSARKPHLYEGGSSLHISEHDPRRGHPLTASATEDAARWDWSGARAG